MSPRLRKFIGMIAILAFATGYVVLAITIGDLIPKHWAAQGAFYAVAGTAWGVPLFPLITWMQRG